ncbi:MAG: cell division protein FtsZ [Elusimicrobiaceae bacterium]|nr:cell division protein FtsZ [Elusimicrobiaceae bacterium]
MSETNQFRARIKCVGIGGGGGNAINHMVEAGIPDVDFVAVNTDAQDLKRNKANYIVHVGTKSLKGLGVGGDPELGKKAAEESIEYLKDLLIDTDLLFITAGMGGGTGTGVAPVLAKIAKEKYGDNILVVAVVTRPFQYEGYKKVERAEKGIQEIQKYADCTLIIPNDSIFEIIDAKTPSAVAYRYIDDVLLRAVKGISEVIIKPGEMNIDFNDLKRIMLHAGCAFIGIGEASGRDRHIVALKQALTSPLLENKNITGAKGLLVSFNYSGELAMSEEKEVMNTVRPYISNSAQVKIGKTYDENLDKDSLKVVIIATNFPKELNNTNTSRKLTNPQESRRWSSIDLRKYIPAIMRQNQEVR